MFVFPMLVGFTALVVDVGTLYLANAELAVATDAAALAGASHIDGTDDGVTRAGQSARSVAAMNNVRGSSVTAPTQVLQFGLWDTETRTFTPSMDAEEINALRVESIWKDVPTPFASFAFRSAASDVRADAIALRPPGEPAGWTACFLPIAIPQCIPDDVASGGSALRQLILSNDSSDNAAWAYPGGVNASDVGDALDAAARGECVEVDIVRVGDPLALQNGVAATNLHAIRALLRDSVSEWDVDLWGPKPPQDANSSIPVAQYANTGVLQGVVPVIDDGGNCSAIKFVHEAPITQLTWGVVYDVFDGPGTHKGVSVFLDLEHDFTVPGGGTGPGNVLSRPSAKLVE
ncbi:MAG: hypothetical protein H6738_00255 [Alphaproteobacteria bacterium]|nr:hypothetical protein [Alphaproteobacteria bacterium]MCB9695198.1 hypothetical protein [Alphaproteobacteria bacterium]